MFLVGGICDQVGEKIHNVHITLYDKYNKVILERTYEYKVVTKPKLKTTQNTEVSLWNNHFDCIKTEPYRYFLYGFSQKSKKAWIFFKESYYIL